jgi:serine/threonine protein kinase
MTRDGTVEMHTLQLDNEIFRIPKKYIIERIMGKGSYGVVCAGRNLETNELVAIKKNKGIFPCKDPYEYEKKPIKAPSHYRSVLSQKRILRELKILIHLQHQNIVGLKDVIEPESYEQFGDVYFVTDLMEADLRDILDSDQELTDEHVQYFMFQILLAVYYMHSANVLHRDLKPENILVKADCELKICDFGLARGMDFENDPKMSTNYVQTRWYRAPELLLDNDCVSKETDIWSIGCIMGELLGRRVMFRGSNPSDQLRQIIKKLGTPHESDIKGSKNGRDFVKQLPFFHPIDMQTLFPHASPQALDLLKKLLEFNFQKRISAAEALRHPYFASLYHESLINPAPRPFNFSYEDDLVMDSESPSDGTGIKREAYETIVRFQQEKRGLSHQSSENIQTKVRVEEPMSSPSPGANKSPERYERNSDIQAPLQKQLSQSAFERRIMYDSHIKATQNASTKKEEKQKEMGFFKKVRGILKKL